MKELLKSILAGSGRRFITMMMGTLSVLLAAKFGVQLDPEVLKFLESILTVYLVGGNGKEAVAILGEMFKYMVSVKHGTPLADAVKAHMPAAQKEMLDRENVLAELKKPLFPADAPLKEK